MGKKRSNFIQEQKINQRLISKAESNMNHNINKRTKRMEKIKADYNDTQDTMLNSILNDSGLDLTSIPKNSRILIYELLKKNLQNNLDNYTKYIEKNKNAENIQEFYDSKQLCIDNLEQIDWIYNWTKPLGEYVGYADGETEESRLEKASKKVEGLDKVLVVIDATTKSCKKYLYEYFYRFCKFIIENDTEKYNTYISNTIKNLLILDSEDPIVEYLVKDFKEDVDNKVECEK